MMHEFACARSATFPAPEQSRRANAIAAARSWDIDLETHCSQHFSREVAEEASLIVIFDETNRKWIEERYPTLKAPVVMLGSFLSSTRAEPIIADPGRK